MGLCRRVGNQLVVKLINIIFQQLQQFQQQFNIQLQFQFQQLYCIIVLLFDF